VSVDKVFMNLVEHQVLYMRAEAEVEQVEVLIQIQEL